jgi:hypothetical protein
MWGIRVYNDEIATVGRRIEVFDWVERGSV